MYAKARATGSLSLKKKSLYGLRRRLSLNSLFVLNLFVILLFFFLLLLLLLYGRILFKRTCYCSTGLTKVRTHASYSLFSQPVSQQRLLRYRRQRKAKKKKEALFSPEKKKTQKKLQLLFFFFNRKDTNT